jgi:hypothetical protein
MLSNLKVAFELMGEVRRNGVLASSPIVLNDAPSNAEAAAEPPAVRR